MEITVYQLEHFLLISIDVSTESLVTITAQALDNAINHCRTKDIVLFENCALAFNAIS